MATSSTVRLATDAGVAGLRRWGDGAPDVVLLHGAGGNRDSLAPLGDALEAVGLTVAAVSMPGRPGPDGDPVASIVDGAAWLAALLAELVLLPGAGHWLPVEEADQVADAVAAFVRRLGA